MKNTKISKIKFLLIATLLAVNVISCGGQNRTDNPIKNSIQVTSQRNSTDAYSALEQLFVANGNSITNSEDFTGLNRFSIFTYPTLPDFNASPGVTQVFNYIDLTNSLQTIYQVDITPGWLYHVKAIDDNDFAYGVNSGNFPVYSLEFNIVRENLNDPTIFEYFTHIDYQTLQSNTQNLLQSFLYFPETADCMQIQNCTQRLFITIRAISNPGVYLNAFQFHDLRIDALPIAAINTITDNAVSGIIASRDLLKIYNNNNKVFTDLSSSDNYEFIKYDLIEINSILFNRATSVDFYSLESPPKDVTLVTNPASIWFALPYMKFAADDYYFNQDMSYQYLDNQQTQTLSRSYHGRIFKEQPIDNRWFLYRSTSDDSISSTGECGLNCKVNTNRFDSAILQ